MKYILVIVLFFLNRYNLFSQELILDDGIYIEKSNPRDTNRHKYTLDNVSYKLNKVFIYDYHYTDINGTKYKFIRNKSSWSDINPLNLTEYSNTDSNTIDKIRVTISDYLEDFTSIDSTYSQTVFTYDYLNKNGEPEDTTCIIIKKNNPKYDRPCGDATTGVIDNGKNIWIHPPRNYTFKILQLNPYPFYYLDENIKEWSWNFETGGLYLDSRWIKYEKLIRVYFNYTRQNDKVVETPMGKITCKVTNGLGTSNYGDGKFKTSLISYYNSKYGFVKLEYTNINGSKLIIDLIEVK